MLFILNALSLFARDIEITVFDADLQLPLEGAIIRNWDGAEYICGSNGKVIISVPDNRPVLIQGAYPGYTGSRIAVNANSQSYTMELRLSGVMENRELVIEAARPGTSESQTGRSVAVSGREIAQSGEIGIIEDVMTTIKLLPGVGYTGMFNAQPSIRGGDPGDMNAALDGYYIANPYHWGGGFSIFDPKMIQSARLSHGVFSSRYGHTISGLLELSAKKASATETEFELGINTSASNFNLSLPFSGRGGLMFMGRITYYDPVVFAAKQLSKLIKVLEIINSIKIAPYIRSGTITADYRLTSGLNLKATGFWGMDGVEAFFENGPYDAEQYISKSSIELAWANYQGFFTTGLSWNPRNDMLLNFSIGTGYEDAVVAGTMKNSILNKEFNLKTENLLYYDRLVSIVSAQRLQSPYDYHTQSLIDESDIMVNAQGRLDFDWETGKGFLAAAGVHELFSRASSKGLQMVESEKWLANLDENEQEKIFNELLVDPSDVNDRNFLKQWLRVTFPVNYPPNALNSLFTTSAYILTEYASPKKRINAELGLRVDHYYLLGTGFALQSKPVLNPRLNIDFNVFNNLRFFDSFDISAGTGLFNSMSNNIFIAEEKYNISELKPNRSWTSVLGLNLKLGGAFSINAEGYYKQIFDRLYIPITLSADSFDVRPQFNGKGRAWGIDIMLQKMQSRFWDGWLSYSYNWTKYKDPDSGISDMGILGGIYGNDWYFPSYHRFHNLNLILNIKPVPRINIYARFGFASGLQMAKRVTASPVSFPMYVYDSSNPSNNYLIEIFRWPSVRDENNRSTPSLPLDIKFSIYGANNAGKTRYEVYAAVENILALVYSSQANTSYNQYTGREETGSMSASYEIPIPIPSFGFKISY